MKKYALVVGISQYEDPEITDLQFAARDAEMVGTCLAETCGFDEVRTLTSGGDREPSHVNVVDALHNLAPRLSPDDLFLFYFAGHGIQTGGGAHLLTCNSRIRMPELASVSTGVLSNCLLRIECADRVLVLDACRNDPHQGRGDQDNLMTAGFSRDIVAVAETPAEGVVPATWVLFSCRPGQRAYEWPDMQHGAFTHYLLEGLQGAAADDRGQITVQVLGRYVEEQVPRWARKCQTPRVQTPWGEHKGSWRDIVLVAARAEQSRRGRIEVLKEPVLRVETTPPGATVSIDGQVRGTTPVGLPLRPGKYRVRVELSGYAPIERRFAYDALGDARLRIVLKRTTLTEKRIEDVVVAERAAIEEQPMVAEPVDHTPRDVRPHVFHLNPCEPPLLFKQTSVAGEPSIALILLAALGTVFGGFIMSCMGALGGDGRNDGWLVVGGGFVGMVAGGIIGGLIGSGGNINRVSVRTTVCVITVIVGFFLLVGLGVWALPVHLRRL